MTRHPGTRPLGATGLTISPIGLGLAALGRPGYINLGHGADLGGERGVAAMEARAHAVLDAAWQGGVRYLDAARSYGLAEAFLGGWLDARGIAPGEVAVGSKWGYTYPAARARAPRDPHARVLSYPLRVPPVGDEALERVRRRRAWCPSR